jgi:hypothetical protein
MIGLVLVRMQMTRNLRPIPACRFYFLLRLYYTRTPRFVSEKHFKFIIIALPTNQFSLTEYIQNKRIPHVKFFARAKSELSKGSYASGRIKPKCEEQVGLLTQ